MGLFYAGGDLKFDKMTEVVIGSIWTMSIFTGGEIENRQDRLRARLGDCDAFVALSFTNAYYLSGVPIIPWGRPTFTLVPRDGGAAMVLAEGEKVRSLAHSPIDELITYRDSDGPNAPRAVELLAEALKRRGLKRIAFDAALASAAPIDGLRSLLPEARFIDASQTLDAMRLVSSDEEVELLRRCSAVIDHGMETYLAEARLGEPEVVLAGRACLAMAEFSASTYPDAEVRVNCYSQQGIRSLQPHTAANGDPLSPGQLMCVVVEAHVWHYMEAVERTLALGDISPAHQAYYDAIVESQRQAIAAVGPGVPCSEVDRAGREVLEAAGYTNVVAGTGLARGIITEWEGRIDSSNLRDYNATPLEPNIVLTVEPWAVEPEMGAPRHCDVVRVTETGREVMTKARSGAIRIG